MHAWRMLVLTAFVFGRCRAYKPTNLELEVLDSHNLYRRRHNVPPVMLNKKLSQYATDWAKYLATRTIFAHRQNTIYGENLYASKDPVGIGKAAVDAFYNEIKYYDFDHPKYSSETNRFTQMVWKNTKEIGVGQAKGVSGNTMIVVNYFPPGNIRNLFQENVLTPTES